MSIACLIRLVAAAAALAASAAAPSQVRTVDPDAAMQQRRQTPAGDYATPMPVDEGDTAPPPPADARSETGDTSRAAPAADRAGRTADPKGTFQDDDVFAAAEGVFGKGAEGLAKMIEGILKKQGRPNAYIAGREGGGAFVAGVRYGSGTMHHKVEGDMPVYWTGPSIGFDVGANGAKTFVLVYNLYDSNELFHRFPAAEGDVYVIGGFTASYLRRKDVVLIPIRLGVGWRLGANVGYMRFSRKSRWSPF